MLQQIRPYLGKLPRRHDTGTTTATRGGGDADFGWTACPEFVWCAAPMLRGRDHYASAPRRCRAASVVPRAAPADDGAGRARAAAARRRGNGARATYRPRETLDWPENVTRCETPHMMRGGGASRRRRFDWRRFSALRETRTRRFFKWSAPVFGKWAAGLAIRGACKQSYEERIIVFAERVFVILFIIFCFWSVVFETCFNWNKRFLIWSVLFGGPVFFLNKKQ